MGKITFFLFLFAIQALSAQTTFNIPWQQGMNISAASPTVEKGDTVQWIWGDSSSKSVTSLSNSNENFDSGMLNGRGNKFSHTFQQVGENEYQNDANPAMSGKVTVVEKLSVEDKFVKNLSFYPNPVRSDLTIFSLFKLESYQIYNVLGSLVAEGSGENGFTQVDMGRLNSGMYFVKVFSNNLQATFKIAKK